MKTVEQSTADMAFEHNLVQDVCLVGRSSKEWYFTFTTRDPASGSLNEFAIRTQRGELRTWADPRTLLNLLQERYGVTSGRFTLDAGSEHGSDLPP